MGLRAGCELKATAQKYSFNANGHGGNKVPLTTPRQVPMSMPLPRTPRMPPRQRVAMLLTVPREMPVTMLLQTAQRMMRTPKEAFNDAIAEGNEDNPEGTPWNATDEASGDAPKAAVDDATEDSSRDASEHALADGAERMLRTLLGRPLMTLLGVPLGL